MRHALLLVSSLLLAANAADACTSAVISGKVTPDGRPLLWKNRDTDYLPNHVAFVKGEKFDFVADVNSENFDSLKEAWIGMNSAGFAIMNTQSYNLVDVKDGEERGAANGSVIYRALELCETVEDFMTLLDTISKPSLIEANFGVIDAKGGAMILEVDYYGYTAFDANNPKDAPYGYIARTNFSFSGKVNEGAGYVRYEEADHLLKQGATTGGITPQYIVNDISRSFHNPMLDINLYKGQFNKPQGSGWFVDQDFIPRNITSCSVVVQGVKDGENPELSTMWTLLGYPPTGLMVPVLMAGAEDSLPYYLTLDPEMGAAPLSHWSLDLADKVFSYRQGSGTNRYLNWEKLYNDNGDGYMQVLSPSENYIFTISEPVINQWRKEGKVDAKQLTDLYKEIGSCVKEAYSQNP